MRLAGVGRTGMGGNTIFIKIKWKIVNNIAKKIIKNIFSL